VEEDVLDEEELENENGETEDSYSDPLVRENKPVVHKAPSFKLSEGTRNDLLLYGQATDPFTGKLLKKEDFDL
jgi:hypothetical protein